jgi:hypothetical protein
MIRRWENKRMPNPESFIHKLMHRRGCTFGERFVRLLIVTGPFLVALEVLSSGVLKETPLLPWFIVFSIPGTLLFVAFEAAFEHGLSKINKKTRGPQSHL